MEIEDIASKIVAAAMKVHNCFRPGHIEIGISEMHPI
jgi:hypothetical protein